VLVTEQPSWEMRHEKDPQGCQESIMHRHGHVAS
jgi:hypothetical protein